ncbi:MAG: asparagine synthase-related protein, partial [Verrucomicrobiota bacterium]
MGAIFGCLDTHDTGSTIAAMSESLLHRGAGDLSERETEGGAVAVRGPGRLWTDPEGDITIAIGGTITPRDPEEILRCFRESRLDTLRGSFVLAIAEKDRIHLIRDAAGRRTIYHGRTRNGPVFAIEPKAIWSLPSFVKSLRPAAVAEYLTFSFIPGRGTMLENLFEVPAGHVVTLQKDRAPRIHRWFRPEETSPATRSDDEWIELFQNRFSSTIREMRPLGKPAAVFLSGGIDSSIVAAELASQHDAPVHTFAVHFGKRYPNELPFARTVADHCGTAHEEILVEPRDFLSSIPEIVRALDEPIGDPVAMPNYLLAKAVSECGFDRVFNGEGGDPCFGGPK